nr:zinc finger protein 3-like [Rhipicephalus microplus]
MFTVQKMLDHHRRIKHHQRPQGKHSCAHCPYSSNQRSSVIRHERTHMGEKPFVCHVCCKGFTDHGHLKTHLLVHTGEKPYECSVCGQRFTTSSGMARHQRSLHSGNDARLHMCAQCGKGFMESSALTKHRLIHTGAKPHACSVCGVRFTRLGSAKKHELVVHGRQYPLHCPHCNKGFAAMCFLRKHMLAHHSDDSKENSEA